MRSRDSRETAVLEAIQEGRDELIDLATSLVRFDTTARLGDEPARDEAALQALLAARLEEVGAEVELWEPRPSDVEPHPQVPPGLTFEGRPQLVARLPGDQRRRTLLFNGHIDAVPADPIESWTIHPFEPEVKDGCLYGRGTCDMKGGVAAMVFAVETLRRLDITLPADLLVNTVTDEESCGAGTLASLAHGLEADAAIVPEPTNLSVVVACRGILNLTVTVRGRPGHATVYQPDWREGGAVNAIEKAAVIMSALRSLEEDWARRPSLQHPHLPAPTIVPTLIKGGEWKVSYPANCAVFFDIAYMPAQINSSGAGSTVRTEIAERIAAASNRDGWLAAHPPELEWGLDMPPGEVNSAGGTIVDCVRAAAEAANGEAAIGGLDSWHDAASLIRVGRIPTVDFGPANVSADGRSLMHAIDEHVPVDDLVATAKTLALAAMRFE